MNTEVRATEHPRNPQVTLDFRFAQKRFDKLILPRRGLLTSVALRLTGRNHTEAEDLVQETLVRAYTHIANVTNEQSVDGWLCTTLRHLYFNRYRKCLRTPCISNLEGHEDSLPQAAGSSSAVPETVVLCRYEYRSALDALAALPWIYRIPVVLADVEELSYQEIAERLDVPLGTVRSRIARGRALIRRRLYAWTGSA